jgi:hypothetical protein
LNPGPPKCKAEVLTTLPWHLVRTVWNYVTWIIQKVLSNDATWQNILIYEYCYHYTALRSASNKGDMLISL